MPACPDCAMLEKASAAAPPHASLLLHSQAGINFGGTATGHVEYYLCNACGAKWARTVARSEPDAVWERTEREFD